MLDRALDALAADDHVDHRRLAGVAAARFTAAPGVAEALARLRRGEALERTDLRAMTIALDTTLDLRLLRDHVFASADVETALTALRASWLDAVLGEPRGDWPSLGLLAAVALQMHTTEWVYEESHTETDGLATLAARRRDMPDEAKDVAALVHAMYRPLSELGLDDESARRLRGTEPTAAVYKRHLVEPAEERSAAAGLPRLTAVTDAVSEAVQAQYEEQPYPRWRHLALPDPRPLGETVAAALGNPDLAAALDISHPHILIAGCGTGRHAVMTAARYRDARVLAIDLSLRALAHGASRAHRLGIRNVEFAQADILALDDTGRRFDVVECVGVLHHMADPEDGLARLSRLTRPGGLLKLGLYSRYGRRVLDPVTSIIRRRRLEPTLDGIRELRSLVRALPADDPARRLTMAPDFFTRSGCRDLFFHAHEDRFDIPRIAHLLDTLGLEFLGFELPSRRLRSLYLHAFPDEPTGRRLVNWDALERSHPLIFSAMYRFWVRAAG